MISTVIITILVYSAVASAIMIYKEWSSYYFTYWTDVVVSGPIMWALVLVLMLIRPLVRWILKHKKVKYQVYTRQQIEKIAKKIVRIYRKKRYKGFIDFRCITIDDYSDVDGWEELMVRSPKYEIINRKYERVMYNQKKDGVSALLKYFTEISDEEYEEVQSCYYYEKPLYKLKEAKITR